MAGIAAAMAGAREVVLLDREPLALACALMSARASGLAQVDDQLQGADAGVQATIAAGAGVAAADGDRSATHAQASTSGSGSGDPVTPAGAVRAALFDWSRPPSLARFDVVLACDVLYEPDAVDPIASVIPRLLKSTSGALLLADPPNRTAPNRERFLRLLREGAAPFAVEECYEYRWGGGRRAAGGAAALGGAVLQGWEADATEGTAAQRPLTCKHICSSLPNPKPPAAPSTRSTPSSKAACGGRPSLCSSTSCGGSSGMTRWG